MANLRVGTGITFDGATGNFNTLGIGTVRGAFNATGAINATSGVNVGTAATIHANGNVTCGIITTTNIVNSTALTNRNLIINGAMQVAQRGDTASVTSGYGGADRFKFDRDGATAVTLKQGGASDSPVSEGFSNCQHIDITTADTSMGSANYNILTTRLEGYNLQGIQKGTANARELTLSFYIKSTVTGTYIAELVDQTNSARHVNKAYTISASNTWEHKVITFPADTTGTITSDHNRRLDINWWLGAGSNYNSGTLQTSWGSDTNANRAVGQVNAVNSTSNDIMITGVQLEVGSVATPFEHRSFGDEMARCKRYYNKVSDAEGQSGEKPISLAVYETNSAVTTIFNFPKMRNVPTLDITNGTNKFMVRSNSVSDHFDTMTFRYGTTQTAEIVASSGVSGTAGYGGFLRSADTDVYVAFSAEL